MKKYFIIFCSLLIMIISLFFVSPVHGLSSALSNSEIISLTEFYTSIDNLQMIYIKDTEQSNDFFTSSTNSFPIPNDGTISGTCFFNSDASDVTIGFSSSPTKSFLGNYYDTKVYYGFGQQSSVHDLYCYYGQFFMPINRDWNTMGNTELKYLVEYSSSDYLNVQLCCTGYYPVLLENGFYMQPFEFVDVVCDFDTSISHEFSLYSLLVNFTDISQYIHNNFLYIETASLEISAPTNRYFDFSYYFNRISNLDLPSIDDYEVSLDIDISPFGTALLNGVTNFLRFEIIPGFSLLDLLFYCCAVPLLIAILKIFLGG